MRTVGVEEEFLLVDGEGRTVPAASAVLDGVVASGPGEMHRELLRTQVEAVTGVCTDMRSLREELADGRARLAAAAAGEGLRLVASGTAVLPFTDPPPSEGARYQRIAEMYQGVVSGYQCCGCHVHVGVPDRETAIGVMNHLRPWLPILLALSVNSPHHRGFDTGYASWRIMEQARFPGGGIPPRFASIAQHDELVGRLVECGALVDPTMTFWSVRPSPNYPTVEIRVADSAATAEEAVLLAAMARGLVEWALAELSAGREGAEADGQVCAAALWNAARHGMDGPAVDPVEGGLVPAWQRAEDLLALIRPFLEDSGDTHEVDDLLGWIRVRGTGAVRQRRAATAGLPAVVDMLARQTAALVQETP